MENKDNLDSIITYLAQSLDAAKTTDELLWDLARKCISKLNFEDCIIYLFDPEHKHLVQKAAFGPKNPEGTVISNPIIIPIGEGIVGSVALNGIAELIGDTSKDSRYIVDDVPRYSELAVPIKYHNFIFGVIDSEHSRKDFFTSEHLHILTVIAGFTAYKLREISLLERIEHKESGKGDIREKLRNIEHDEKDFITLNTQVRTYRLHKSDIIRAEADGNYCNVFTNTGMKIMMAKTLKNFEKEIASPHFIRPHKSHLVNSKYVNAFNGTELYLTDNTTIQVSVRKQPLMKKILASQRI